MTAEGPDSAASGNTDLFFRCDREGLLWQWNQSLNELSGYTDAQLRGENLSGVFGVDAGRFETAVETAFETGAANFEGTVVTDAGTAIPYEFRLSRLTGDDTGADSVVGVGFDISARRRREHVLEELHAVATTLQTEESTEAVYEQTIRAAANILNFDLCCIYLWDGDGLVRHSVSRTARSDGTVRMDIDEGFVGKTYRTGETYVVGDILNNETANPVEDIYRSGISVPIGEYGVFQAVHSERYAFDDEDAGLAELLITHTVTALERIERERELKRQNERLENFADVVSHDLRNPLSVATGRLELLQADDNVHLDAIGEALDRMETLVDDLLRVATEGSTVTDTEPGDLSNLVESCWRTVETANAMLVVDTSAVVRADYSRTRQLFENLFRNAIEHGGESVTITVGDLPDGTGFYVEDDGTGIPKDEMDRVFEYGYSTSEDSTGFGLAIVNDIATAHDWTVCVTEGGDGGARFEFSGVDVES